MAWGRAVLCLCWGLVLAAPSWGQGWEPVQYWRFPLPARTSSRESKEWKPRALVPVGKERFLLLWEKGHYRLRFGAEEAVAAAREKGVPAPAETVETLEQGLVVSFCDRAGRLGKQSPLPPQLSPAVPFHETSGPPDYQLLVLEVPSCAYGVLHRAKKVLQCLGWQLEPLEAYQVPLEEVDLAEGVVEGEGARVWVFGRGYRSPQALGSFAEAESRRPEAPESYGAILELPKGEWRGLPIGHEELLAAVQRRARDETGSKVKLRPESLRIFPVAADKAKGEPLGVVVTAVAAEEFPSYFRFRGWRLFFRGSVSSAGLGTLKQLPLFLRQGEGKEEGFEKAEKGTLVVEGPGVMGKLSALLAWRVGEKGLRFFLRFGFKEKESVSSWGVLSWVVGFEGESLEGFLPVFPEEQRKQMADAWSSQERRLIPSTYFLGRASGDTVVFSLFDFNRQAPQEPRGLGAAFLRVKF